MADAGVAGDCLNVNFQFLEELAKRTRVGGNSCVVPLLVRGLPYTVYLFPADDNMFGEDFIFGRVSPGGTGYLCP